MSRVARAFLFSAVVFYNFFGTFKCNDCEQCRKIINDFIAGVNRTSTKGFSGGNTHWEQRNIGSYATSEIRFDDIINGVCSKSDSKCHDMLGSLEALITDWWTDIFRNDQSKVAELSDYVCLSGAKYCCPLGHFGKECEVCPLCINGFCDGNGTRIGSGMCQCNPGYYGEACSRCHPETHFDSAHGSSETPNCQKCHSSCAGGCRGPEPSHCTGCATGWNWVQEDDGQMCKDIDECQSNPCENSTEYCLNTAGSYECHRCSASCDGCHGPSSHDCVQCRAGYHDINGTCEDINECETDPNPCRYDGQICRNTPGSYVCECQPHFERRGDRCVAKDSGKLPKVSKTQERKSQKSPKVIWTVNYLKEFGRYIASLLAFALFAWCMQRRVILTISAGVALGAFIYHQSITLDGTFSKQ